MTARVAVVLQAHREPARPTGAFALEVGPSRRRYHLGRDVARGEAYRELRARAAGTRAFGRGPWLTGRRCPATGPANGPAPGPVPMMRPMPIISNAVQQCRPRAGSGPPGSRPSMGEVGSDEARHGHRRRPRRAAWPAGPRQCSSSAFRHGPAEHAPKCTRVVEHPYVDEQVHDAAQGWVVRAGTARCPSWPEFGE